MPVDWDRLGHAYGQATDTPTHLDALEFGDAEARAAALDHLDIAVLHQGFPETATAPAIRAVTALLAEGRAHPDTVEPLLEFLGDAALSVTHLADDRYFAEILPDLADAVAQAYPVVLSLLVASPPDRALFCAENLVAIAQMPSLADRREELAVLILEWSERGAGLQAEWMGCLGQLGVDLRDRVTDPDPGVRLQAALAHKDDPQSRELILEALAEPPPPGLHQFELVAAAIRVAADFNEIAAAACQVASRDSWAGFDDGWGALVRFAFPKPYGKRRPLTDPQHALLRALVANDTLWDATNGSCGLVFKQAGLPHSRSACRRLAG
ncbi:hypothetical protein U2F26_32030 [Micromonospora sp. 4G57]|uniref:HEAT repeat domain-containing protein n=1 Tax=Micromonospora sicca TaxID=2202420 RepID=A0ABU5JNR8_9ACTN|nr:MULTISPECIES: hypothetical protein [unclassified Micromonospora]MDZ5447286.1 hypothetical protein [Micromonospora sp. 4G57]MDZ5494009.1 hypothetical protein [Micromonospora sp. 4G53]